MAVAVPVPPLTALADGPFAMERFVPVASKVSGQVDFSGYEGLEPIYPEYAHARLEIAMSKADSERARALYRQMKRAMAFDPRAELGE